MDLFQVQAESETEFLHLRSVKFIQIILKSLLEKIQIGENLRSNFDDNHDKKYKNHENRKKYFILLTFQ